jgi:hypothetical protein
MKQLTINGYTVTVFQTKNGTQLFIQDANGFQIYAHKVSSSPLERAVEVIESL